jgi:hypothetical protein
MVDPIQYSSDIDNFGQSLIHIKERSVSGTEWQHARNRVRCSHPTVVVPKLWQQGQTPRSAIDDIIPSSK